MSLSSVLTDSYPPPRKKTMKKKQITHTRKTTTHTTYQYPTQPNSPMAKLPQYNTSTTTNSTNIPI